MSKHTPGPWFVDGVRFVRQEPAPRHVICRLPTTRNEGDARLIAAAPQLLEASINARDMLSIDRQSFVDCQRLRDSRTEDPIAHGLVFVDEETWITPEDAEALRDYDRALGQLSAAIAAATAQAGEVSHG